MSTPKNSLLADLQERRRQLSKDRRLVLDIPGYGGNLAARYKPLELDQIRKVAKKAEKKGHQQPDTDEVTASVDMLINACETILVRPTDDADLIPMHEAVDEFEDEVRFDRNLALALGIEGDNLTARKVCQQTFNNDLALLFQSNSVVEWSRDSDAQDEEAF